MSMSTTAKPDIPKPEIAPEAEVAEEDDEQSLPQPEEDTAKLRFDEEAGSFAAESF